MLKHRILSALVMIPAAIAALFLLSPVPFAVVIGLVCVLGAWEWAQFFGVRKQSQRVVIAVVFAAFLAALYAAVQTQYLFTAQLSQFVILIGLGWWLVAVGLVITYPKSAHFWNQFSFARLLFGIMTLIPFFFAMLSLREIMGLSEETRIFGSWSLLYVMLLVWGADSGAYAFGRLFGKHKLAPSVSPGKTWEGTIGGILTAGLIAMIAKNFVVLPVSPTTFMIASIFAVIASIFGDLTESMFKRDAGIKDSSHLIPGHGGVLDRIDSLTAAIPVFVGILIIAVN